MYAGSQSKHRTVFLSQHALVDHLLSALTLQTIIIPQLRFQECSRFSDNATGSISWQHDVLLTFHASSNGCVFLLYARRS